MHGYLESQTVSDVQSYVEIDSCWISQIGSDFVLGLLPQTAQKLGKITFIDQIPIGKLLSKGGIIGVLETSIIGDWLLKSPINAQVTAFNYKLNKIPNLIATSPFCDGWIIKCKTNSILTLAQLGEIKQNKEDS